jgi:hypothetical protein
MSREQTRERSPGRENLPCDRDSLAYSLRIGIWRRPRMPCLFSNPSKAARIALCAAALLPAACGGGGGRDVARQPITVDLPISTVVVSRGGTPVTVPIQIRSTSETALVKVTGLPSGVGETYAATDTNPSGILTFTAADFASKGTFMPTVTVVSAGQTASAVFTLIVKMS